MSQMDTFKSDLYEDGRTKQSFKDQTDINKILFKAAKGGTISHLAKHGAVYGDFSDIDDLLTANQRLEKGKQIFNELPAEVRQEFGQDPRQFFNFVNNPENVDKLGDVLPQLAESGRQLPPIKRTPQNMAQQPETAQPPQAEPQAEPGPPE